MSTGIRSGTSDGAIQFNGVDILTFGSSGVSNPITASSKIPTLTAIQAGGALTFSVNAQYMDFRSTTLTDGTVTTIYASPGSLVLPSGGTLGAVSAVATRIVVVEINVAGIVELAIINLFGGTDLSETGLISTTAISASSTANNVFYSTTARSNVAYRLIGTVDVINTTGAWGTPSLVQGAGGQALVTISSLGYGQNWQTVSRTVSTTYYNTTGKPIIWLLYAVNGSSIQPHVNGIALLNCYSVNGASSNAYVIIPVNGSYYYSQVLGAGSTAAGYEFR